MSLLVGAVIAVIALLVTGVLSGCAGGTAAADIGSVKVFPAGRRSPAPALAGDLLTGGTYDLAAHRGEVVVVNFWASWCAPCRSEAAALDAVHQATTGGGVSFIGIDVHDEKDAALAFTAGRVSYPSLFDPASRLALGFKVPPNTIPATLVVDRSGRIAAVIRKATTQAELQPIVERIAAEHG